MASSVLTITLLAQAIAFTSSHSWLECTDYRMQTTGDGEFYNPDLCHGYSRCGTAQAQKGFGHDTGFSYHNPAPTKACQCPRGSSGAYTATAPKAKYKPGQTVCLAYPAKNHVAEKCTNIYIPDNGVRIFRTPKSPTSDPNFKKWPIEIQHMNGKHQQDQIDYKGFQNCPKFCEDPDKSLCTLCFKLESDISPGEYSFNWEWHFNNGDDFYSSCWEAVVEGDAAADDNDNTVTPRPNPPEIVTPRPTPPRTQPPTIRKPPHPLPPQCVVKKRKN